MVDREGGENERGKLHYHRNGYPSPYAINGTCKGKATSRLSISFGFTNTEERSKTRVKKKKKF